jgi:hypothetical protein
MICPFCKQDSLIESYCDIVQCAALYCGCGYRKEMHDDGSVIEEFRFHSNSFAFLPFSIKNYNGNSILSFNDVEILGFDEKIIP